jgi:beta-galactosidase GanA
MKTSRRTFLQSTAPAFALTWGGLKLYAGHSDDTAVATRPVPAHDFICGSLVYRPPNPPRAERREVLRTMSQDHHFNLMRAFPTWDYYQRGPNDYNFAEIEELMHYCDELGLKVLMGVAIETAPYWLEQAHPETRWVDSTGQAVHLRGNSSHITGGFPGLCLDWEPVQVAARAYIHELVGVVSKHPSMYAWDAWNEPVLRAADGRNIWATTPEMLYCYCERTIAEFRQWLKQRYTTIDGLNAAWSRLYPDWDAVDAPRILGTAPDWVDWRRYMIDRSVRDMHLRADTVRAAGSKHMIGSHAGQGSPPLGSFAIQSVSTARLAEVVDFWGLSQFPRGPGARLFENSANMELARSSADGKEFWLTELQGGDSRLDLVDGGYFMRPKDIRTYNWLALATGAKAVVYWQYMPEGTGQESMRNGLVSRDGSTTDRVEEADKNHTLIQAQWGSVVRNFHPRPQIAILYDQDNALLTFAMTGNEKNSIDAISGYYKGFWEMDLPVDFIEPDGLSNSNYKVVVAPWHLVGKESTCAALQRYVESGGTLILEAGFGLFDERFFYNPVVPPHGLAEIFGYQEEHNFLVRNEKLPADASPDDAIYYQPPIEFSEPVQVRMTARTYLTPIKLTSAKQIASSYGKPLGARKRVGQGEMIYVGTCLGAALLASDAGALELLRSMVQPVAASEVTAEKVRPRLMRGEGHSLLAVFNDTVHEQTVSIRLPVEFQSAKNIHSGNVLPIRNHMVELTIPNQDVMVLQLDS